MSFDGHVLCQRMLIAPWALTTFGAATADAVAVAAATLRKLRRVGRAILDDFDMAFLSLRSGRRWRPNRFDHQLLTVPLTTIQSPPSGLPRRLHTYPRPSRSRGETRCLAAPCSR